MIHPPKPEGRRRVHQPSQEPPRPRGRPRKHPAKPQGRRRGGQPGNRNRWCHGRHSAQARCSRAALRAEIRAYNFVIAEALAWHACELSAIALAKADLSTEALAKADSSAEALAKADVRRRDTAIRRSAPRRPAPAALSTDRRTPDPVVGFAARRSPRLRMNSRASPIVLRSLDGYRSTGPPPNPHAGRRTGSC